MTRIIKRDAVKGHLDNGDSLVLVEALPENYFNEAHLPGAVRINHDEIDAKASTMLPDKTARIIVYCANAACENSTKAARALADAGYVDVLKYAEGKADWVAAGLPTEGAG